MKFRKVFSVCKVVLCLRTICKHSNTLWTEKTLRNFTWIHFMSSKLVLQFQNTSCVSATYENQQKRWLWKDICISDHFYPPLFHIIEKKYGCGAATIRPTAKTLALCIFIQIPPKNRIYMYVAYFFLTPPEVVEAACIYMTLCIVEAQLHRGIYPIFTLASWIFFDVHHVWKYPPTQNKVCISLLQCIRGTRTQQHFISLDFQTW